MAVPTQYIFNLYWFTKNGPDLPDNQIQDVPQGGWSNWTLQHNMLWLQGMIAQRAKFVLIGSIYDLRNQGENAGSGINNCTVGVEVLVLLHAGYLPRLPNLSNDDERGVNAIRVFEYAGNYTPQSLMFVEWVKTQQSTKFSQPYGLWTEDLKNMYLRAID
jgi:hypothetical protein